MTTTSTFQGMDTDSRNSSRVLNPPGGASSNIFGGNTEDTPPQKKQQLRNADNVNRGSNDIFNQGPVGGSAAQDKGRNQRGAYNPITGQPYDTPKPQAAAQPAVSQPEPKQSEVKVAEASGSEAAKSVEASPPPANDPKPSAAQPAPAVVSQEHTSTRVSQPPGGRSTKLW
ncbi:jupiter microtubule associated homolog 1 [Aplysia californica]|uniref:Microtubule-associated protein Jupiter n=1 Tax=Aplysia californica TaxID=6500 RepID=A0ABM0JW41_APLCA|nr:jupiter microtubule associated homolog 1 [Aplysia californica]